MQNDLGLGEVRDKLTAREGWISTSLLSHMKPEDDDPALSGDDKPSKPSGGERTKPLAPQISETTVIQRIIAGSRSMRPGSCARPTIPIAVDVDAGSAALAIGEAGTRQYVSFLRQTLAS
ncbi:hypothetical protein [Rhizobium sp. 2MFCol3.1]|uniref:hypothetical protein n=1 Tax=Rhizobium sp. 2MFCol3.1 TaxID=1246459 RepID=UPI0003A10655|nr:hypothetical protein [Rhizobium sp. 2MFCol3.1]